MATKPLREGGLAARIAVIPGDGIGKEVTPEAIKACVTLTSRYITDRFLPDKAIDALDEFPELQEEKFTPNRISVEVTKIIFFIGNGR